jgi:hypothetical protein
LTPALLDDGLDVLHEGRVVDAPRMGMALHQARHQGGAELRMEARRVIEREGRHVDLAGLHGFPLLLRLDQAGAGENLDFEPDLGRGNILGDHLHHFVAHVALAARKLVRGLESDVGSQCRRREDDGRQHAEGRNKALAPRRLANRCIRIRDTLL